MPTISSCASCACRAPIVGLLVGAALGAAGTVMQGLTRNPLADPGILGVNAGAALFVVIGIYSFGLTSLYAYVWFAFAGAAVASVVVYSLGSLGREGATPVKLALAGAALTALLGSITTAILLVDVDTLDQFRFWIVGSLAGRTATIAVSVAPFIVAGLLLALACGPIAQHARPRRRRRPRARPARRPGRERSGAVAIVLLCGAAIAAAGPIVFVGLAVPHIARAITGPDYRWIMPYSIILAPVLLLGADVIGRVVARPGELQVGIVTAVLGAPDLHRPRPQPEDRRRCEPSPSPPPASRHRSAVTRTATVDDRPAPSPCSSPSACRSASATSRSRSATSSRRSSATGTDDAEFIVRTLRLPRALTGVLVGVSFGLSGAIFQSLARNPLASPDIIGIDAGASAAAVFCIVVLERSDRRHGHRRRRSAHSSPRSPSTCWPGRAACRPTASCSSASASPPCCRA